MSATTLASDSLRDARVVVVGAGAIGAAVSYRLAQAGAQVTTVERHFPGGGTTGRSFAWLNSFNKLPRDYHRLNTMGIRDHQDLADELDGTWLHLDGGLHWAGRDDPARLASLRLTIRHLREWGTRVDATTPEIAMRDLAPDLWIDPETVPEVYFVPREGWLETVAFAHGVMHAAVTRYGARLERATVVGLRGPGGETGAVAPDDHLHLPTAAGPRAPGAADNPIALHARRHPPTTAAGLQGPGGAVTPVGPDDRRHPSPTGAAPPAQVRAVSAVVLDDGRELPADVVINAAGPDAPHVAAMAGVTVPIDRQLGMLVCTAPAPVSLRQVVRTHEVHLRPDGGARLMITHDRLDSYAEAGRPTPPEAPEIQEALARARRILPGLADVPAEAVRIGTRALPRDGLSIVGFEPSAPGLYTVATHSGITLSARLALLVTEDLLGADPPELAPLRPARFAESTRLGAATASDE